MKIERKSFVRFAVAVALIPTFLGYWEIELRCSFEVMEQEVQLVNPLVDVPVAAHPGIICKLRFNLIQPVFRAVIYRVLVNHRQKCLDRFILERAGV